MTSYSQVKSLDNTEFMNSKPPQDNDRLDKFISKFKTNEFFITIWIGRPDNHMFRKYLITNYGSIFSWAYSNGSCMDYEPVFGSSLLSEISQCQLQSFNHKVAVYNDDVCKFIQELIRQPVEDDEASLNEIKRIQLEDHKQMANRQQADILRCNQIGEFIPVEIKEREVKQQTFNIEEKYYEEKYPENNSIHTPIIHRPIYHSNQKKDRYGFNASHRQQIKQRRVHFVDLTI